METKGEINISPNYNKDSYLELSLSLQSSEADWNTAIAILKDRIEGRYINQIDLLSDDVNANGFTIIWRYFSWCNQTLSVFTLWAITVYLVLEKKNYFVTYVPALFMTYVVTTYICIAPEGFQLPESLSYAIGTFFTIIAVAWFNMWKNNKLEIKN